MAGSINGMKCLLGSSPMIARTLNGVRLPKSSVTHLLGAVSNRQYSIQAPVSKPEGRTLCTLIPGDGVGPELMQSMQEVIEAAGAPVDFETYFLSDVQPMLSAKIDDVVNSVSKNAVCIKGILSSPLTGDLTSLNYQLRSKLDLFANVVNVRTLPGIQTRHKNIDIIIIREQTEGEFSSLEHESGFMEVRGVVECYKIVTAEKSKRIAKFAFDYATKHNRKKVTAVHKANIMKLGDGLFLKCCTEVAKLYPKIQFDSMIIDNCTMQLVSNPHQFDVLVMGNLYGSIVDNIGAGLVGGAGVVVGSSYSANSVVYEPGARHTFAEATGKNVANPTAIILCAAKMLMHVNLQYHGSKIYKAVEKVMKSGKTLTKDMGGQASSQEYTYAVINALQH